MIQRLRDRPIRLRVGEMSRPPGLQRRSPTPHQLQCNILNPPRGRNQVVRLAAVRLRVIQEHLAIVGSRVFNRAPIPRRFIMQRQPHDQHRRHLPAAAVEIIQTTRKGVEHFQSNDFSPNIVLDEPRLPFMVTQIQVAGVLSRACDPDFHAARMRVGCGRTSFHFTAGSRQCFGHRRDKS